MLPSNLWGLGHIEILKLRYPNNSTPFYGFRFSSIYITVKSNIVDSKHYTGAMSKQYKHHVTA
jgi:hypothetical protein